MAGARLDGSPLRVHFATRAPELDARWRVVELRSPDGWGGCPRMNLVAFQ